MDTLASVLRPALENHLKPKRPRRVAKLGFADDFGNDSKDLARDLAAQAATAAIPFSDQAFGLEPLSGGNTAETVGVLSVTSRFVIKADSVDAKLAREATVMRNIRNDAALSRRFREAIPIIYAVQETAPYAYLMQYFPMEDGWISLEDRLYPTDEAKGITEAAATRCINAALDILFEGYGSRQDLRRPPDVNVDYVGRIRERLTKVASLDERFASRPLSVNGTPILPWKHYLERLEASAEKLRSLGPHFSTVVHGDPNPGNILLRTDVSSIDVKLIDPKDWGEGDYLFDIAKITHFLTATGPIEKPANGEPVIAALSKDGNSVHLDYRMETPAWTDALVEACRQRAEEFAEAYGDENWEARYELGMAANILGLPDGRLAKGRVDAALALFGEGLMWLDWFCRRLPNDVSPAIRSALPSDPTDIVPRMLSQAREFVTARVPKVREELDRRGFSLLHWSPPHPNDSDKPAELSLEHEGRLLPATPAAIRNLRDALAVAIERREHLDQTLLRGHERFADVKIIRLERDTGPQSIDRYWDVVSHEGQANGLIARGLSFRERLQTSSFMTWSAGNTKLSALNLELPVVPLGSSGVVARLEFNWIDNPQRALAARKTDEDAITLGEPFAIAAHLQDLPQELYEPVIEHTTFREKFVIHGPDRQDDERFHLNIDTITVQSLKDQRIASYVDVDIAPAQPVDGAVLADLISLVDVLRERYDLTPNPVSKVLRDAETLGLPLV
ncbi:MAG: phosphotransferase [Paracoccaceae bacterium]|nr:phosphotransferase [Paracoccaceae bacterium]